MEVSLLVIGGVLFAATIGATTPILGVLTAAAIFGSIPGPQ